MISTCLDCLKKGKTKEGTQHQADHQYFIYPKLNFPLLTPDWTAKDELQLVQGIMKCGLGNWKDVADQFVKTKTLLEGEEHYYAFYIKSRDDKVPKDDEFIIQQGHSNTLSSSQQITCERNLINDEK